MARIFLFGILGLCVAMGLCGCAPSAKLSNYDSYRVTAVTDGKIPEGKVKVTFLGVATLLIDDGETQLLTDGFVTRPSLFKVAFGKIGSDSAIVKSVIRQLQINRLKAVFTAHSHYDHAMDAPCMAKLTGADLYGSSSTLNIGIGSALPQLQIHLYQPGKPLHFGKFTVTVLKSKHTPALKILGTKDDVGQDIATPLRQPAGLHKYVEGGAYDVLIVHNGHKLLIKASTNFIPGALDSIKADVLFLGVATLSKQDSAFQNEFYRQTAGALKPQLLIPIHWDNFFKPLSSHLQPYPKLADNVKQDFDFLIRKCKADKIDLKIMQGYDSIILF